MTTSRRVPFDHTGWGFDSFLEDEGILEEVEAAAVKRINASQQSEVKKTGEAYQRLLDIAARADAEEGIRQGLDDAKKGKLRPAREFFAEFEAMHGLRR
jgi:hypothetical protein